MPDRSVEKPVCAECGAEAVGQALFCYHCGSRLVVDAHQEGEGAVPGTSPEQEVLTPIEAPPGDPFAASDDSGDKKKRKTAGKGGSAQKEKKKDAAEGSGGQKTNASTVRTATSIRKDLGVMKLRRIETRWTPEEGGPNIWFIVGATILFIAAFGVFLISMYLR